MNTYYAAAVCKPLVSSHKIIILSYSYFAEDYYIQIHNIGVMSDIMSELPQSCNVRACDTSASTQIKLEFLLAWLAAFLNWQSCASGMLYFRRVEQFSESD